MNGAEEANFLPLYIETARSRLNEITSSILAIEKDPREKGRIADIFITAHTLKSESAMMGFNGISSAAHAIEDVMDSIKRGTRTADANVSGQILEAIDAMGEALGKVEDGEKEPDLSDTVNKLRNILEGGDKAMSSGSLVKSPSTLKVKSVIVPIDRLDRMMNLIEETVISRAKLDEISKDIYRADLRSNVKEFDRLVSELEYEIVQARLVSLSFIFDRIPRLVRDLAHQEKKKVEVKISGGDIALDKSIIDHLLEPLVHLVRNSISHGIEEEGTIEIKAERERDRVRIVIADDGHGVDVEAVKREAVKSGLLSRAESDALGRYDALNLIFAGVTTSAKVTELSGRGIGMKAVKQAIDALSGKITVDSTEGKGTTFTVTIPLTLAITKVLLVVVEQNIYAVPSSLILKNVQTTQTEADVKLIDVGKLFGGKGFSAGQKLNVVVVETPGGMAGLVVDRILDEDEIIVKPLPMVISGIHFFQATTVLSDGRAALLLDVPEIVESGG